MTQSIPLRAIELTRSLKLPKGTFAHEPAVRVKFTSYFHTELQYYLHLRSLKRWKIVALTIK